METKIKIQNLTKFYGTHKGIENLSLEIYSGEIFGFLGPNGAGKTTTIRCLMNILLPSAGEIWINGSKVERKNPKLREKIGYIAEAGLLPGSYTTKDFLSYVESMRGTPSTRREELIKRFDLPVKKKISELSKGNKQKVSIIAALMHDPEVLILDEPTSGLDPLLQQETYDLILDAKSRGKTIFFSSHNLAEVQRICDRVGIVRDGHLISVLDVDSLNKEVSRVLEVTLGNPNKDQLRSFGDNLLELEENRARILVRQSDSINKYLEVLIPMKPEEIVFPPASLEDYFMQFYKDQEEVTT
ncbi:MAG: ABC transporter ATP-binding protein [Candidatus Hodarchaeales archaeon]|jgi:ABC-2 type transport system ATP-binding protein